MFLPSDSVPKPTGLTRKGHLHSPHPPHRHKLWNGIRKKMSRPESQAADSLPLANWKTPDPLPQSRLRAHRNPCAAPGPGSHPHRPTNGNRSPLWLKDANHGFSRSPAVCLAGKDLGQDAWGRPPRGSARRIFTQAAPSAGPAGCVRLGRCLPLPTPPHTRLLPGPASSKVPQKPPPPPPGLAGKGQPTEPGLPVREKVEK